jgi:hypothetical protein
VRIGHLGCKKHPEVMVIADLLVSKFDLLNVVLYEDSLVKERV